jgi:hypothetical protein
LMTLKRSLQWGVMVTDLYLAPSKTVTSSILSWASVGRPKIITES